MCHGNASEQKAMTKCQLKGIRETKHSKPHQNPNHPFSFLKLQTFLMSQHPWASLCAILNHTNKPIDLNGVIRSSRIGLFSQRPEEHQISWGLQSYMYRGLSSSGRSRQCCLRDLWKQELTICLQRERGTSRQKKKKKKRSYGARGKTQFKEQCSFP